MSWVRCDVSGGRGGSASRVSPGAPSGEGVAAARFLRLKRNLSQRRALKNALCSVCAVGGRSPSPNSARTHFVALCQTEPCCFQPSPFTEALELRLPQDKSSSPHLPRGHKTFERRPLPKRPLRRTETRPSLHRNDAQVFEMHRATSEAGEVAVARKSPTPVAGAG